MPTKETFGLIYWAGGDSAQKVEWGGKMKLISKSGEIVPLAVDWNGIKSCPDFTIREGQTFGEAARLSQYNCEFCRMCRSEDTAEGLDSSENSLTVAEAGRIGGTKVAKERGPEFYRKLQAMRKHRGGGRPRKPSPS